MGLLIQKGTEELGNRPQSSRQRFGYVSVFVGCVGTGEPYVRGHRTGHHVRVFELSLGDAGARDLGFVSRYVGTTQTDVPAELAAHWQACVHPAALDRLPRVNCSVKVLLRHCHLILRAAWLQRKRLPLQLTQVGIVARKSGLVSGHGDVQRHRRRGARAGRSQCCPTKNFTYSGWTTPAAALAAAASFWFLLSAYMFAIWTSDTPIMVPATPVPSARCWELLLFVDA